MRVDVRFRIQSVHPVPRNNGYQVFAAVSKTLGGEHLPHQIGVFHIGGTLSHDNMIRLTERSTLGFRCPVEDIGILAPLMGRQIEVGGTRVQIGTFDVHRIVPETNMRAFSVYFNGNLDAASFTLRAQYDLDRRNIKGRAFVPPIQPDRILPLGHHGMQNRIVQIKEVRLTAFAIEVHDLSSEDSERLIVEGMGGRRHFGCGLFLPIKTKN